MRKPIQLILALAFAATAAACERPANDTTAGTAGTSPAADARPTGTSGDQSDNQFVKDLTSGNMTEVALGRVAQQKTASADVKAFGEMMVRDHTKALDALKQAAERQNIQVPAVVNEKHRELRQLLTALTAKEFDREYMNAMVDAHEATVSKLEDRADDGNDALSQFASTILPTVRHHLEQAKQVRDRANSGR